MIFIYLVLIIFFCVVLIKATDILMVNFRSLAESTRLGRFAITSFLLALGTSLPELFVGVTSAIEGKPNFALGNIVGSNIADISLVIGGAALLGGEVAVRGLFLQRDIFYTFLAGTAPMLLLLDKNLSRIDGLILLALYGFYNTWVFAGRSKKIAEARGDQKDFIRRLIRKLYHHGSRAEVAWIFLGIALLLFSADMLVKIAAQVALILNIPILLIGIFLVALGTSLPELVFELKAIREKESEMAFGDLLGSVVANSTLIIGLTAFISPIRIRAFSEYLLATIAFVLIFAAFFLFVRTKRKLESWEGAFLLGFYLAFVLIEIFRP